MVVTSAGVIVGGESQSSSTLALDTPALAFEHVLASLARLEARLDASERRAAVAQPPPRLDPDPPYVDWQQGRENSGRRTVIVQPPPQPEPDPPYADWHRGREISGRQSAIVTSGTAVSSMLQLDRYGVNTGQSRSRQAMAWDNPTHRLDIRPGRHATEWDRYGVDNDGFRGRRTTAFDNPAHSPPIHWQIRHDKFEHSLLPSIHAQIPDREVDQSGITGDDVAKNMEEVLYNVEEEHCYKQSRVLSMDSKLKIEAEEVIDCDATNSYTENVSSLVNSLPNDNHATEENRDDNPEDQRLSFPNEISPPSSLDRIDTQLTMLLPVATLMPVMKGDFRVVLHFVLQKNVRDVLEICLECCDPSMTQFVEMHLMYMIVLAKVSLGAVFIPMKVVKIFISNGQVKHFGYGPKRAGHVGTLGAYSSLRLQRITRRRRVKELEFDHEESLGLLHLVLHISVPVVRTISLGWLEVHEIAAFVLKSPGFYEAINRNCPYYYLSSEFVALFTDYLPSRPSYIVGQASKPYGLPVDPEYFIVTVAMLPDATVHLSTS
ncbi:hypothetical protein SASPL_126882 [Salvia splendens]|uniref:Uncharacterized protein n=1 Tax=Salvia splendens TaxID=180675 RepID=A0A8X8ZS51_SALSN|nr:hypothetical protein SASPL_126882 [Salvia splendens]